MSSNKPASSFIKLFFFLTKFNKDNLERTSATINSYSKILIKILNMECRFSI